MASVAIPMVAGFAAQKLATDVLGVDPKMAAILGMAAGGGAGAWASGGGSLGSLFGNTAGSAAAGQGASTIGSNMFGQTAGMSGMSSKVGGGLLSAAGTTGGAVPASLGYDAMASMTPGMDMFAGSAVNPHAGLSASAFPTNPYIGPNVGNADAPADLFQTNAPILQMDTQMNTQMPNFSGPQMNPQMNTQMPDFSGPQMNPQMNTQMPSFAPTQYDQMASMYPGMDDPSLYMNTSATTTPLPNRLEIPSQNYDPRNPNYQADEDMYTAQLFKDGNTVSGWSVADDLDYDQLGGGGDSIAKDMEYQKWLNDRTLVEQGNAYDDMAATNPIQGQMQPGSAKNWQASTPEYDAYTRASHGMDGYAINEYDQMARGTFGNFEQVPQAVANTQPNPRPNAYNPGPAEATGTPPVAVQAVEQSEVINDALNDLSKGDDKPSWWDKSENQQFLMQAASILLSDDIEEQQQVSSGGGGGGPPSPGTYSGGSSPAPKVVFGMGPYNGQGQQGYNPREIM